MVASAFVLWVVTRWWSELLNDGCVRSLPTYIIAFIQVRPWSATPGPQYKGRGNHSGITGEFTVVESRHNTIGPAYANYSYQHSVLHQGPRSSFSTIQLGVMEKLLLSTGVVPITVWSMFSDKGKYPKVLQHLNVSIWPVFRGKPSASTFSTCGLAKMKKLDALIPAR